MLYLLKSLSLSLSWSLRLSQVLVLVLVLVYKVLVNNTVEPSIGSEPSIRCCHSNKNLKKIMKQNFLKLG